MMNTPSRTLLSWCHRNTARKVTWTRRKTVNVLVAAQLLQCGILSRLFNLLANSGTQKNTACRPQRSQNINHLELPHSILMRFEELGFIFPLFSSPAQVLLILFCFLIFFSRGMWSGFPSTFHFFFLYIWRYRDIIMHKKGLLQNQITNKCWTL